jgi:hypothetical protein
LGISGGWARGAANIDDLIRADDGDFCTEAAQESDGAPSSHVVGCGFDDATGKVDGDAEDSTAGFWESSVDIGAQEGEFGVLSDLALVLREEPSNVWMAKVKVRFVDGNDVGSDGSHVAEKIENVKAVGSSSEAVNVLKVDANNVGRVVEVVEVWTPGDVGF